MWNVQSAESEAWRMHVEHGRCLVVNGTAVAKSTMYSMLGIPTCTCVARIRRLRIRGLRDVPAHLFDHGCARTVDANPRVASVVCASVVYEMCRRILLQLYFTVFFRDYRYL